VRFGVPVLLLLLIVGCGGESLDRPAAEGTQQAVLLSSLDRTARGLLPPTASAVPTSDGTCFGPFDRPTRCVTLHVRGAGRPGFLASARSHGWRLIKSETQPAGSTTLVFRRGRLEGRVLLARSADLAMVVVTERSVITVEESRFVASGRAACKQFAVAVERIPRSLPREEGLRRVQATWRTLVRDVEHLTPPAALRSRHRAFLAALRAFERALVPLQPNVAAEAAKTVDRSAQALGLPGCIPSG
jgi:hypothetical protein